MRLLIFQTLGQYITGLFPLCTQPLQIHVNMDSVRGWRCRLKILLFKPTHLITWTGCSSLQTIASPSLSQRRWTSFPLQASGIFTTNLNQQVHHLLEACTQWLATFKGIWDINDGKARLYYLRWSKCITQIIRYEYLLGSFCEWDPFWGQEGGHGFQWPWFSIKSEENKLHYRRMVSDNILLSPAAAFQDPGGLLLLKLQSLTL